MSPVVSVGGRPLSAAMDAVAMKLGVPENEELKWSPKRGSWIYDYLHEGSQEDCYREILEAAAAHNAKAAVVCWDSARTAEKDQALFERRVEYCKRNFPICAEPSHQEPPGRRGGHGFTDRRRWPPRRFAGQLMLLGPRRTIPAQRRRCSELSATGFGISIREGRIRAVVSITTIVLNVLRLL